MNLADKQSLFAKILEKLEANLQVLVETALVAKEASTNEESKAENKYDTRGLEASYLASGQAKRAQKLQEQIFQMNQVEIKDFSSAQKIAMGALVKLSVDDQRLLNLFLLPVGGVEVEWQGRKVQSINIDSPLGQNLFEQPRDHDFVINAKEYEVRGVF